MSKHEIPIKCLIIDDEISYANVLAKRMRLRGIEATPVYGGREAIQLLKKESFHVALLDLKMDDMDGIEVLKMFRIIEPMMRVVILTGHGGKAEADLSIENGAYDYLVKPCDFEKVVSTIKRASIL